MLSELDNFGNSCVLPALAGKASHSCTLYCRDQPQRLLVLRLAVDPQFATGGRVVMVQARNQ